jgi:hypothetical protein
MKGASINPSAIQDAGISFAVIPADAGIQSNQDSGFRVKPEITIDGLFLNTQPMKPAMDKKVEFA